MDAARQDVDVLSRQLVEYKRQNSELKANIADLNDDLARYRHLQDENASDVSSNLFFVLFK